MRIVASICRWLSSGLIGLVVSSVAFASVSVVYERLQFRERLGVDDDVCWLALAVGPALIVVIHRGFHKRAWIAVASLVGGSALAGVGVFQLMQAREAESRHVPSGLFSGIEYAFAAALSWLVIAIAALAVLGGVLALGARHVSSSAASRAGGSATPPRTPA